MAHRASSSAASGNAIPTVTVPAGVATGDIVILGVEIDDVTYAIASNLPSGFAMFTGAEVTLGPDGGKAGLAWKRTTGADTGAYALATTTTHSWAMFACAFSGRDGTASPVASVVNHTTGATTPVSVSASTLTAAAADDLLWASMPDVGTATGGNRHTVPTSPFTFTSRADVEDTFDGFSNICAATSDNVTAGATGTVTGTLTLSTGNAGWAAYLVQIPVSGGGGGGSTIVSAVQSFGPAYAAQRAASF